MQRITWKVQSFLTAFMLTGETVRDPETEGNTSVRKEKSGAEPIIIPIILKMAEFDHKVC